MVKTGSSFCALSSKCVRIGNYSVIPRGRILTTDSFLQMKVPKIVAGSKEEYVTLDLPLEDVVNVLAFFGSVQPVLFFFLNSGGCRKVRELLRMKSRHSLFLDNCAGQDDSQKRLTVLLERVGVEDIASLKSQLKGKLHEIKYENAFNILQQSAPKDLPENWQDFSFILAVKKSFTESDLLFLVWQESEDDCGIKMYSAFLEECSASGSWKVFEQQRFSGTCATSPLCVKYFLGGRRGSLSFRVRVQDSQGREHCSNIATVVPTMVLPE